MTVETLQALRGCRLILCVNLPEELFRDVSLNFKQAKALPSGGSSPDAALCAYVRAWSTGSPSSKRSRERQELGVLFLGHPLVYSAAPSLIGLCRRLKQTYRVLPGVSMSDVTIAAGEPAVSARGLDSFGSGLVVRSAHQVLRDRAPLDSRSATVILNLHRLWQEFPREPDIWRRMTDYLERYYKPAHPAVLVRGSHDGAQDGRRRFTLRALRSIRTPIDSATTLFLPMRRA